MTPEGEHPDAACWLCRAWSVEVVRRRRRPRRPACSRRARTPPGRRDTETDKKI